LGGKVIKEAGDGQTNSDAKTQYTSKFLKYSECTAIGSTSYTGHELNDPLNRGVNLLLPKEATKLSNMVEFGITKAGQDKFNFESRLEILTKICSVINYVFYVAPHGDLMVEFPFYDFIVSDFGDFSKVFSFKKHIVSSSTVTEKPDITTCYIVTGGLRERLPTDVGVPRTVEKQATVIVASPKLFARYGGKTETKSFPFSIEPGDLAAYGMLLLQDALGNAGSHTVKSVFRPFLLPNRPILNGIDNKMGLTKSVENTWTVFDMCTTTYDLGYVRTKRYISMDGDGNYSPRQIEIWRFLTGGAVMGVSYRLHFGLMSSTESEVLKVEDISGNNVSGIRIIINGKPVNPQISNASPSKIGDNDPPLTGPIDPAGYITGMTNRTLMPEALTVLHNIVTQARVAVNVTSASRTLEENHAAHHYNKKSAGYDDSLHLTGRAFDINSVSDGKNVYTDAEILRIQAAAKDQNYVFIDETDHYHFEPQNKNKTKSWVSHTVSQKTLAAQQAADDNAANKKTASKQTVKP
jgi:hypothetical protein